MKSKEKNKIVSPDHIQKSSHFKKNPKISKLDDGE